MRCRPSCVEIEQLLANQIGLDPIAVGSPLILHAVRRRMRELRLNDLGEFQGGYANPSQSYKR